MKHTRWFGNDCLGNTPHAVTMEGVCIWDMYAPKGQQYYNQKTGQVGNVYKGADGELHFERAVPGLDGFRYGHA